MPIEQTQTPTMVESGSGKEEHRSGEADFRLKSNGILVVRRKGENWREEGERTNDGAGERRNGQGNKGKK